MTQPTIDAITREMVAFEEEMFERPDHISVTFDAWSTIQKELERSGQFVGTLEAVPKSTLMGMHVRLVPNGELDAPCWQLHAEMPVDEEPFHIAQTFDPEHLNSHDAGRVWLTHQVKVATEGGATWSRVTVSDDADGLLYEAWLERPNNEGAARWSLTEVTP